MSFASGKLVNLLAIGIFSIFRLHAASVTVLEGFENGFTTNSAGITNLSPFTLYGTPRGAPVTVSLYTSTGPGDPRVTEGANSVKVVFPTSGFGNDLGFALSDAAATLVEQAASSNQPARFILRYDVVFEHGDQPSFFNQNFHIGNDWDYVRIGGATMTSYHGVSYGTVSFSTPLDLPAFGIPTNAPSTNNAADFAAAGVAGLTAYITDNFSGTAGALSGYTIYLDNFRLIDTYQTPETALVVYSLQSFEGTAYALGQAMNLSPSTTTLSLYTVNGLYDPTMDGVPGQFTSGYPNPLGQESDFAVTDGTNCLEVDVNAPYYSYDVFRLPLGGGRLGPILNLGLTPAQLSHYTLRFDVTTPMVPVAGGGADSDYIQIDYNTPVSVLPMSTGRRQSAGQTGLQRETYSLTLDQIASWSSSPYLAFSYSQPGSPKATWGGSPFFLDNFMLINTAPLYTYITAESYNAGTGMFTLTWLSEPSQHYAVQFSTNLASGFSTSLATNIPSGGDRTTRTVPAPAGNTGYLRILAQ